MIDPGLITLAKKAVETKPRKHVTPAILLAVVMQESHGMPYFVDTKPGSIFAANIYDAQYPPIWKDDKIIGRATTGLRESEIRQAITIPEVLGKWRPPRAMVGKMAKFRFEHSYWKRHGHLDKMERFRMSSSWGLVQFMGPNITKGMDRDDADYFIQKFAADVPLQLLYGAGMLDDLLIAAEGNVDHAYRAYNSGNPESKNAKVIARAKGVERRALEIDLYLKRGK